MYDYRLKKELSLTDILSYEWMYHTSKDEILKAWDEYGDEISRLGRLATSKKPLMKFQEDTIKCPQCGESVPIYVPYKCGESVSISGPYKPNFCQNCGQHLDWGGIDEWREI